MEKILIPRHLQPRFLLKFTKKCLLPYENGKKKLVKSIELRFAYCDLTGKNHWFLVSFNKKRAYDSRKTNQGAYNRFSDTLLQTKTIGDVIKAW